MTAPRKTALISKMVSILTWPRVLLFAFLLLACSSAEATSLTDNSRKNIYNFSKYAQSQSTTNSLINTWAPACEFLKGKQIEGCSAKQSHLKLVFVATLCGGLFFLGLLIAICFTSSKGEAILACFIYIIFLGSLGLTAFPLLVLSVLFTTIMAPVVILTKNYIGVHKVLSGIAVVIIIVGMVGVKFADVHRFAYLEDYSFPEYFVASTSTNIVVVHEKIDLPYKRIFKSRKSIIFRDGRIASVSTNELATLLRARAEEIRRFRQAEQPQKTE
jgi:hypothetical protein